MSKKYYVASGWFTPEQEQARQDILHALQGRDFFSPKEQSIFNHRTQNWEDVFKHNVENIKNADIIIASTIGYDAGTMWECGLAYGLGKEIIYYAPGIEKFNLMLAKSSSRVCNDTTSLILAIRGYNFNYCGEIE